MVWDPISGIREKPVPNPGSRGQKGTGSGSATLLATLILSTEKYLQIKGHFLGLKMFKIKLFSRQASRYGTVRFTFASLNPTELVTCFLICHRTVRIWFEMKDFSF
jgi:hypothetical protein